MDKTSQTKLDLRGIGWFLAIAFCVAWLLALPMWLDGRGLASPWSALVLPMTFAPTIATFVVTRWISPLQGVRRATGLRLGEKGSRWGLYWLFSLPCSLLHGIARRLGSSRVSVSALSFPVRKGWPS
jgi:hypothetical protein